MVWGVVAVVLASLAYGVMPIFTKSVLNMGLGAESVVFYRFLLACGCSFALVKARRLPLRVTRRQLGELVVFGALGFGATAALLTASYTYIDTGLATMLHFSYPLFVTLAMMTLFRERVSLLRMLSVAAALGGLALVSEFDQLFSMGGALLALLSGITYAVYVIANRRCTFSTLPPFAVIFYVTLFSAAVFGARALVTGTFQWVPGVAALGLLLVVALVCTVLSLALLTVGIRILGSSRASILNMLEPVTSVICGMVVFGEQLSPRSVLGCLLVIASSVLVVLEKQAPSAGGETPGDRQPDAVAGGEDLGRISNGGSAPIPPPPFEKGGPKR